ncbi:MAG: DUF2721 domain-containing protein [Cytophagales bacterium]|nr:DUF2721 domain-containing protein [Cytophagales bacterium]
MNLTTPALLFPAISLLLLAFTNRFLAIATLIRQLHANYNENKENRVLATQIENLRKRLFLIRNMQAFGVLSFFFCVLSMIFLFQEMQVAGKWVFGASLLLLLISLGISLREVQLSTNALEVELSDMEFKG